MKHRFYCRVLALCFVALSTIASAEERILSFHSDVAIQASGELIVTETITVRALGQQIKRGIYRDLPTIYKHPKYGHLGINENAPINILSVRRDGKAEMWRQSKLDNGIRVTIGDPNIFLKRGAHEYQIKYRAQRQAIRKARHAVMNWNVTGQGWRFPIDLATARITYPNGVSPDLFKAATGTAGSTNSDATTSADKGVLTVRTTRPLRAYEGLTIYSEFDKNAISPSSSKLASLLQDNWKLLTSILMLLAMPIYYFMAWARVGRDPQKGVVVADYHPVRDLSPAAHRAVVTNRNDEKSFAAAVLNMAVNGYLTIEQESKKVFTITKTSGAAKQPLFAGEKIIFDGLFKQGDQITLGKGYKPDVALAKTRLSRLLKKEYGRAIYRDNKAYTVIGLIIGIAALLLLGQHLVHSGFQLASVLPVMMFAFMAISMARSSRAMVVIFVGIVFFGLSSLGRLFDSPQQWPLMIATVFVIFWFALFYYLLKAPTPFGQKLLDEIEGFRLYLSTAEQHRLDILHPPEKTPELFEKLLPYALALDVENQWSEQFSTVFTGSTHPGRGKSHYSPDWYSGGRFDAFRGGDMGAALGAGLASSVASAAAAPSSSSSSSGGFGGGGAGGGGGGGGGGGW